jgi:hypothetical protein
VLRESSHIIHVKRTLLNKEEYIFDMVMKPTNAYKFLEYLLIFTCFSHNLTILREVHYKGYITKTFSNQCTKAKYVPT